MTLDDAMSRSFPWGRLLRTVVLVVLGFAVAGHVEAADVTTSVVHVFHHTFNDTEGKWPGAVLVLPDGTLYGMTLEGGTNGAGTVFSVSTSGQLATLHAFGGPDGSFPDPCLVAGADGGVYGTIGATGLESLLGVRRVFRVARSSQFSTAVVMYPPAAFQGDSWSTLIDGIDGGRYAFTNGGDSGFSLVGQIHVAPPGSVFQVVNSYATGGGFVALNNAGSALVMAEARRAASSGDTGGMTGIRQSRRLAPPQCGDTILASDGHFWRSPSGRKGTWRSVSTDLSKGYYWPVGPWINVGFPGAKLVDNPAFTEANSAYGRFAEGPHSSIWATTDPVVGGAQRNELIEVMPTGVLARRVSLAVLGKTSTPFGGLVNGPDGNIYGLADAGGDVVILFGLSPRGSVGIVHQFANTGETWRPPQSALVVGGDGNLYINFPWGGQYKQGIIYRVSIARP